jgi:carbon-monoxide dehydrogenase iron sulfur subunit
VSTRSVISVVRGRTGAGKETDCMRCMGCEAICSFVKEGEVNLELSRIKIEPNELEWMEGRSSKIVTHRICHQCPGVSPCMKVCPVPYAIIRDSELGTVLIDDSKCTRCQLCIKACPFKAIWYDKRHDKVIKCDLCGGDPQCVKWCSVNVLHLEKIRSEPYFNE